MVTTTDGNSSPGDSTASSDLCGHKANIHYSLIMLIPTMTKSNDMASNLTLSTSMPWVGSSGTRLRMRRYQDVTNV